MNNSKKNSLLMTLDVGNTNMVFGIWNGDILLGDWRIRTRRNITFDELGFTVFGLINHVHIDTLKIKNLIVSSVVPPLRPALERFASRYLNLKPYFVESDQMGMPILYNTPKDVGADRVVGAIAAYERYKQSLLVVDFGTATTFDCISKDGEFLGGAIAPGFQLSAQALFQKASLLPKIEMFQKPSKMIAKSTAESMNTGLVFGYASLVDGLVLRAKKEMKDLPKVVATGGLATLIKAESSQIEEVLPELALEGLKIVFSRLKS